VKVSSTKHTGMSHSSLPGPHEWDRHYRDACLPTAHRDQIASFSAAGRAKLAELRAAGNDPSKGGEVAKHRAAKIAQRMQD
jgi:hypothetical protein